MFKIPETVDGLLVCWVKYALVSVYGMHSAALANCNTKYCSHYQSEEVEPHYSQHHFIQGCLPPRFRERAHSALLIVNGHILEGLSDSNRLGELTLPLQHATPCVIRGLCPSCAFGPRVGLDALFDTHNATRGAYGYVSGRA